MFKGFVKCPNWLKDIYRRSVKYICQECHKSEDIVGKLEPHRIKRGNSGGLYTICPFSRKQNNVKIVCNSCHKRYHQKEW